MDVGVCQRSLAVLQASELTGRASGRGREEILSTAIASFSCALSGIDRVRQLEDRVAEPVVWRDAPCSD